MEKQNIIRSFYFIYCRICIKLLCNYRPFNPFAKSFKESSVQESEKKIDTKIDLTSFGDFQFDRANLKPLYVKVEGTTMNFQFDWRNDSSLYNKRSFMGSLVKYKFFQNGIELRDDFHERSIDPDDVDLHFNIEKNTSLQLGITAYLHDNLPVTVKMIPLEGEAAIKFAKYVNF